MSLGLCEGGDARAHLCSCSKGCSCHPCIGAVKKGVYRSRAASLACPTQGRARSLGAFCWGALTVRPPRGHIPSSSLPRAPGMFLAELAQQHPAVTPLPPRVQEPPHHHHRSPGATPAPGDTALLPGLSQSYPFLEPPLLTDRCRRRWGHLGTWRVPAWPLAVLTNCSEALSQRALLRLVTGAASRGGFLAIAVAPARFEPCPEARGRLCSASQDLGCAEGSAPRQQPGGLIRESGNTKSPNSGCAGCTQLPGALRCAAPRFLLRGALQSLPQASSFRGGDLHLGAVTVLSRAASNHPDRPTVISESSRG